MCRNVTDVDDVLLPRPTGTARRYDEFAAIQQFYFDQDMTALGVGRPALEPRAHAFIPAVIALASGLLGRGAAYERDGQVYFRGAAVAHQAVPDRAEALRLAGEYGHRPDDPRQDDPFDVAVWQASRDGAGLGQSLGAGPAGLARRMRGHGACMPSARPSTFRPAGVTCVSRITPTRPAWPRPSPA